MTPDLLLRKILADACLNRLPLLGIRENELAIFSAWERKRPAKMRANLSRKENRSGQLLGPRGYWAWRKQEYGCWYRPHRLDEVVVEGMYPGLYPDYVTVLSSGPFGGLYLVYRNVEFLSLEKESPFRDKEEMYRWVEQFLKFGKGTGNH
uniref:Uncharacterized protein n=1 Tax=Leptospirillum ferrodiazotrophum TaxID=412449 RepID=C6HTY7_9BACT|nr:MAG: protein of unknown function [Leptospirillum ferrodiazotrophum]